MRNDAHDELDHVPSLTTDPRDHDDFAAARHHEQPQVRHAGRAAPTAAPRSGGTGALWALVGALLISLAGLSWWSYQQISLLQASLVATQESFAVISEEAAGRIKDISGKVVATESNVTSGSEALKLRVKQLENKLAELSKQQQNVAGQQSGQGKRIEALAADLKSQQSAAGQLDERIGKLDKQAGEQKAALAAFDKLGAQVKTLGSDIEALKKQGNPSQAIKGLEQDLLVLRSELDNRPAASSTNTAEFDAFRAQVTRNVSTLQAQVQNLQQQINARQ
ncbi:ATPase [Pseudomonas alcaligenes]|uniref:ATPase n=1 Tax=Aquipseudomonas alcaligenes TaxID=43263 RepID=A0ABR7S5X2_AQUAC|nr:ATPase [Pseudomonas alcaligenes]MBC9251788.1 ATPase [Pseudomonas alcaligenes]